MGHFRPKRADFAEMWNNEKTARLKEKLDIPLNHAVF